jgi:hypothetical protein
VPAATTDSAEGESTPKASDTEGGGDDDHALDSETEDQAFITEPTATQSALAEAEAAISNAAASQADSEEFGLEFGQFLAYHRDLVLDASRLALFAENLRPFDDQPLTGDVSAPIPASHVGIPVLEKPIVAPDDKKLLLEFALERCMWIPHPIRKNIRILLASDASHMMKNLRNCFFASRPDGTREMYYPIREGTTWKCLPVSWEVVRKAYEYSRAHHSSTRPTFLTHSAMNLTNFSKMGMKQLFALVHPNTIQLLEDLFKLDPNILGGVDAALGTIYYLRDLWTILFTTMSIAGDGYATRPMCTCDVV